MTDKYTRTTEVTEENDGTPGSEYKKETTVKTERTVKQEKDKEPIVIVEEE